MLQSQKHLLRISEVRMELNGLIAKEELSEEEQTKISSLTNEYKAEETRYQAALIVEDKDKVETTNGIKDKEAEERAELIEQANLSDIVLGVVEKRSIDGATAELQTELKLQDNQIPLELLGAVETRAVTPAPSEVGQNEQPVIPALFPASVHAFANIPTPMVGSGEAVYPVLSTDNVPAPVAAAANVNETDGAFVASKLEPQRLQQSFLYNIEAQATFGQLEPALRMNLSEALAAGIDKEILTKANAGLLEHGADPAADGAQSTFAQYQSRVFDKVDGRFANMSSDLRVIFGAKTFAHAKSTFQANTDLDVINSLTRDNVGYRVSDHVPAPSNANVQQAVVCRSGIGLNAVCPIWQGVTIIHDIYSQSKKGQVMLTAVMLFAFKILRSNAYPRVSFKVA